MREIKFRAWSKSKNKFWNPDFIDCDGQCWDTNHVHETLPTDDYILMQFTGLHDKSGKEIFEGDIIQWHGYEVQNGKQIRPIRKRAIGMTVDAFRNSFIDDCFHLQNLLRQANIEVIGNVHENPELIA